MWKFAVYLTKSYLFAWLTVVFGFLFLIGLLDSLANGSDIMSGDGSFMDTFRYMAYRAPVIFDRIFIFTIIVAILLTFVKLIRQHELVALLGFGISVPKQILLLAPAVFLSALASIFVINTALPPSVRALQAWGIGEYKIKNVTADNPLWMEDDRQIVKAQGRPNMNTLSNMVFFIRGDSGEVKTILWVEKAVYEARGWLLSGIQTLNIEGADGEPRMAERETTTKLWTTQQTPETIARLAAEPRDLALSDMENFRIKGKSGSKPSFAYSFWFWHRITRPLAALVLLICAVPIMQRTGREETGDKALIVGIVVGFLYLIIDGAMATFAASGGVAPIWAISMPLILFGMIGAYLCLRAESLA